MRINYYKNFRNFVFRILGTVVFVSNIYGAETALPEEIKPIFSKTRLNLAKLCLQEKALEDQENHKERADVVNLFPNKYEFNMEKECFQRILKLYNHDLSFIKQEINKRGHSPKTHEVEKAVETLDTKF
jgi:maltodextrin utilization protein YvdJ